MSTLRPELRAGSRTDPYLGYRDSFYRIAQSVAAERVLIRGRLREGGNVCAVGSYFKRGCGPRIALSGNAVDEIAAYNDSLIDESPAERWRKVRSWLRFKVARMRKGLE